jgi:hypothetical protein
MAIGFGADVAVEDGAHHQQQRTGGNADSHFALAEAAGDRQL